jgi:hypothetical protein
LTFYHPAIYVIKSPNSQPKSYHLLHLRNTVEIKGFYAHADQINVLKLEPQIQGFHAHADQIDRFTPQAHALSAT